MFFYLPMVYLKSYKVLVAIKNRISPQEYLKMVSSDFKKANRFLLSLCIFVPLFQFGFAADNPYQVTYHWGELPGNRPMGVVTGVQPDPDGEHLWIVERCSANQCAGSDHHPIHKLDKEGNTVDFLLTKRRQKMSAQKFFNKAIGNNGHPRIVNIDKSGANKMALWSVNRRSTSWNKIKIRQCT